MLEENPDTLHDMSGLLPCPGQLCGRGVASTLEHVLGHEVEDGGHHVVGKQVVKNLCLHGLVELGGRKITHLRIARTKLDAAQEREQGLQWNTDSTAVGECGRRGLRLGLWKPYRSGVTDHGQTAAKQQPEPPRRAPRRVARRVAGRP